MVKVTGTKDFQQSNYKKNPCQSLKRRGILKNSSAVLRNKLFSFHWQLLGLSVIKCVCVLSQKPTHLYRKTFCKEASAQYMAI